MGNRGHAGGFTLLELLISLAVVSVLVAILLPALTSARSSNHRVLCAGNQRLLGQAWESCLADNDDRFPSLYVQPAWLYGGVRFSPVDEPFLDLDRPLNRYLPVPGLAASGEALFCCPADHGITDELGEMGTGHRTAYRAFGTSYRANTDLLGLRRGDITTSPSRLVVMGDPFWHEVREKTGLRAGWHGARHTGNLLFFDGSVRYVTVAPRPEIGPVVFDPVAPEFAFPGK